MTYPGPPQQPYGQQPAYAPAPPPKKGLGTGAIVAIVIGAVVLLGCLGLGVIGLMSNAVDEATGANRHTIVFEVTSTAGKATINWSTLEDSAILTDEKTPWTKTVELEKKTGLVGVLVSGEGRLTCTLKVDGKVVDTEESDGTVNCAKSIG